MTLVELEDSSIEKIHALIDESGFFSDLNDDEVDMLAQWTHAYTADAGTVILEEGEERTSICIIARGKVNIFKEAEPEDVSVKVAEIEPGACIGEMSVIDGKPISATAVAEDDSVVLMINDEDFHNMLQKNSTVGVKILLKLARIISMRLRHTTGRLAESLATD